MSFTGDFESSLPNFTDAKAIVDVALLHASAEQLMGIITHDIPPKRVDDVGNWIYSPDAPAGLNFFAPVPLSTSRVGTVLEWDRLDSESLITTDGVIPNWYGEFHYHEQDETNRAFLRYDTTFINLHGWDSTPEPHEVVIEKYVQVGITVLDASDEVSVDFTTNNSSKPMWHCSKMHEATRLRGVQTGRFDDPYERNYQLSPENILRLHEMANHFFMELKVLELANLIAL